MSYLDSFAIPVPGHAQDLEETFERFKSLDRTLSSQVEDFCKTIWAGEIPERLPLELVFRDDEISLSHFMVSSALQSRGYYARATKTFASELKSMKLGTVLDPFAGSGFMVKALREAGIPAIATDNYSWNFDGPAEKLDAIEAIWKYADEIQTVLLSWVPYGDSIDMEIYNLLQKDYPWMNMLVISEGPYGCTGSTEFAELHQYWELVEAYETTWALKDYCAFLPGKGTAS